MKVKELATGLMLQVIVGAEIATNLGDVIGFYLSEEIKAREYYSVIEEIQNQNGIVYLPHPFSTSTKLHQMDVSKVDAIEVVNGRKPHWQNEMAKELVADTGKVGMGGSDSHLLFELGSVYNQTEVSLTDEESLREIIRTKDFQVIQISRQPRNLPIVRANHYLSWIRAKKFRKFLDRSKSMVQRIAERIS